MLRFAMVENSSSERVRAALISPDELGPMQKRSDAKGLARLVGHLGAIGAMGTLYALSLAHSASIVLQLLAALAFGFTLVTMFAAMHEGVHRTAFKSPRLNDGVAWFAGLLSFYNSTFYRPYHGWHHRFTQLAGKDPELEDKKPVTFLDYLVQMSGLPWWYGKLRTHFTLALGKTKSYPFLSEHSAPLVVRSVRLQLAVYGAGIAASALLGYPYFVVYWLAPVALAQPLLRLILLAEHGGCSEDDNPLTNTRSTHTLFPVRYLMWEMPYHAEHHRYPALPFFTLAQAHHRLGPHVLHVARHGYLGMHLQFLKTLRKQPSRERTA
ncbi:MAG: fatty acid desaturase [Pseudomonadota bacterium]